MSSSEKCISHNGVLLTNHLFCFAFLLKDNLQTATYCCFADKLEIWEQNGNIKLKATRNPKEANVISIICFVVLSKITITLP